MSKDIQTDSDKAVGSGVLLGHWSTNKFMKTFKCNFGKGVTCEVQVTDSAPPKGSQHILKTEWTGKPSQRVIRPYVAWMNSVNKLLADEWGLKLMHVFQTKPSWTDAEIWVYEPNKPPKRVVA